MLTTLRIKNLALVSDLSLQLEPGYNAITGETGAGKSIIIGALKLVIGERADRTLIRSGSDSCTVEAVFTVPEIKRSLNQFLDASGLEPCENDEIIIKRTFSAAGTNRQFVNGSPTTLAVLEGLGDMLVDMHGPHEHQSLLHREKQLAILDAFGGLAEQREQFSALLRKRLALAVEKAALIVDEKTYAQQLDLLRFQVQEIEGAKLSADEEPELEAEYKRASNASRLIDLGQNAIGLLAENEVSLISQAGALGKLMQELQRLDPSAGCVGSLHEQAMQALRDVHSDLSHYLDRIDVNPQRLHELEERINLVSSLKRKYGQTLSDVISFGEAARAKLTQLEQRDSELARINSAFENLSKELLKVGKDLTAQRKKIAPKLSKAVSAHLQDLGFKQSHFDAAIVSDYESPAASGFDSIEFQFAPNPGEPPRPLRAIASSGEMARVMLALKTALAAQDEIPLLVFDEVDANVGGETANAVGAKMREIAGQHQVICITHLPNVAAQATAHYVVTKTVKDGRTVSEILLLKPKERVDEISRMLGGQTPAARKHAEAMLKSA